METVYRVLLVDDEPDIRDLWKEEIESWGYVALTAKDGQEAFDLLSKAHLEIHAVLSDINMPKLDGLSLLKKVREAGMITPFLFLTGYGDKEKSVTALRLGALDFFEKPFDTARVGGAIRKAAQLGVALSAMDRDLMKQVADGKVPTSQVSTLREAQRQLLIMKNAKTAPTKRTGT